MLVAIGAQQLPVTAVSRIVVMVAVFMMDFQQLQIAVVEAARASSAYPREKLKRLGAITCEALVGIAARVADDLI